MSEAWLDSIERELGATVRRFRGVGDAMRWYGREREKRMGRALSLEFGGSPRSQASVGEANATYARIAACLVERHEADDEDEILLFGRRVAHLLEWYAQRRQQRLADTMNMTLIELSNYAAHTERVIRRRMAQAKLLEGRE